MNVSKTMRDDYDTPWKDVLERYFQEFMAFYFPAAHAEINWTKGYQFMDKEFQQITKEADTGRRYVDKLAKVFLQDGSEAWGVIHTDIQNKPEPDFAERMYTYNYRIFDKFRRPVVSFAVLGKIPKKRRPNQYERKLWGCEVWFKFPVVNLSDYEKDLDRLLESDNPFAIVTAAHLLAIKTARQHKARLNEKINIVRRLYQKGFSRQNIIDLFRFIDWVLSLPHKDEELFWEQVTAIEKEKKMPYMTTGERIGYRKGFLEGVNRGITTGEKRGEKRGEKTGVKTGVKTGKSIGQKEGQAVLLARLIAKKYKSKISTESRLLKHLEAQDLMKLGDKLFDFDTLEEVHAWIENRLRQKSELNSSHGNNASGE